MSQQLQQLKEMKLAHLTESLVLGDDVLQFMRRMNRTFVNEAGTYLKFHFHGTVFTGARRFNDNLLRYYDKECHLTHPFKQVQCDVNESGAVLIQRKVQLPIQLTHVGDTPATRIVTYSLGYDSAFVYNGYCFIGRITTVSDTFRDNDFVDLFFRQSILGKHCYVDAQATTFFVLDNSTSHFTNDAEAVPKFL